MPRKTNTPAPRQDINERITEQVIEAIERDGVAPWCRPWVGGGTGGAGFPLNAVSDKAYRGVNVMALLCSSWSAGFSSGYWMTYKQAKQLGGNVRKGEKGTHIIFWKLLEDKKNPGKKIPLARGYVVFNAEQCEGLPAKFAPVVVDDSGDNNKEDNTNDSAEALIASSECPISYKGTRAFYSITDDAITMPPRDTFKSWAGYYTTAFHEMGHATGHNTRLAREFGSCFGNHQYSKEELVAELTACFLAAQCDFARETFGNSVSYLKVWVSKLRDEPKMLMQAAQAAQKAADRINSTLEDAAAAAE